MKTYAALLRAIFPIIVVITLPDIGLAADFLDSLDRVINQRVSGCNTTTGEWSSFICDSKQQETRKELSRLEQFIGDNQAVVNRMQEWVYIQQKVSEKRMMMLAANNEYRQLKQELSSQHRPGVERLKREFYTLAELRHRRQKITQWFEECEDGATGAKLLNCQQKREEFGAQLSQLEAMEVTLISSSPLLSHSAFGGKRGWFGLTEGDGGLLAASHTMGDQELERAFERQLKVALDDTQERIQERVERYNQVLTTTHQRQDGSFFCNNCTMGIADFLEDNQLLFDLDPTVDQGDWRNPHHAAICRLSQKYYLLKARGVLNNFLLDSALVITPMGIAGAMKGAMTVLKAAPRGVRAAQIGMQVAGEGVIVGAELSRLDEQLDRCSAIELDLSVRSSEIVQAQQHRTAATLDQLGRCRQKVRDRVIDSSIALLGGVGLAGAHLLRVTRPMINSIKPSVASSVKQELLNILQKGGLTATDAKMTGAQFNQLYDDLLAFARKNGIKVTESTPGRLGATGVHPKGVDRLDLVGFKRATDLSGEVGAAARHELAHMFHTLQMRATLLKSHGADVAGKALDGQTRQAMNNYLSLFESSSTRNYREFERAVTSMANPALEGKALSRVVNTSAADYSRRMTSLLNGTEQATLAGKVRFPHGKSLQDVYGLVVSKATIATGGSFTELAGTRLTPAIFAIYYSNNTYGVRDKVDAMLASEAQ